MVNVILGGAGFIGSNLVRFLMACGEKVIVIDNLSNGSKDFLPKNFPGELFFEYDLSNPLSSELLEKLKLLHNSEELTIWHLAANSDIQKGTEDFAVDFHATLGTTLSALNLATRIKTHSLIFASSSAVYGDHGDRPLDENVTDLRPISNYGVMKLASELVIQNYSVVNPHIKIRIYRFPNVIGLPLTHGVLRDFHSKLKSKPQNLHVLGNGEQQKPFMHVDDLITNMITLNSTSALNEVFNLSSKDDGVRISEIAEIMIDNFSPTTKPVYQTTPQGWIGDIPKYSFDTNKSISHGAASILSSRKAVEKVVAQLKSLT
jgi:UDP-glucose 4-epimerase